MRSLSPAAGEWYVWTQSSSGPELLEGSPWLQNVRRASSVRVGQLLSKRKVMESASKVLKRNTERSHHEVAGRLQPRPRGAFLGTLGGGLAGLGRPGAALALALALESALALALESESESESRQRL